MNAKSSGLSLERDGGLSPVNRTILSKRIKDDIDRACVRLYNETEPRRHLGASVIGEECSRRVWYSFRWFREEVFNGRMLRLFNRGHREEERFVGWLREIGFEVFDVDPSSGDQWRVKAVKGHFGGSLDGRGTFPYPELKGLSCLLEFKTHNEKSFVKLVKDGVQKSKPRHYKQMCTYGRAYNYRFGLYFAICKNDDEIHTEIVELDWSLGDDMYRRAEDIITARLPPSRIAENPTFYACKRCHVHDICFYGAAPQRNCRSCRNAWPVEDGEWYCDHWRMNIPRENIKLGCQMWARLA